MKLRNYIQDDASTICTWIQDEKSLYQWSADRIGIFPLSGADLNYHYEEVMKNTRLIPLTATDEKGEVVGHLFIRYPDSQDESTVRLGFVIANPALRGCGNGKEMLRLTIAYAKETLHASKITLGVFLNNESARYCYEAAGFRSVGSIEKYETPFGEWECLEMELLL